MAKSQENGITILLGVKDYRVEKVREVKRREPGGLDIEGKPVLGFATIRTEMKER